MSSARGCPGGTALLWQALACLCGVSSGYAHITYIFTHLYLIPLGERMLLRCSAIAQLWQCTGARERDLRCMQLILYYPSADYF